MKGFEAYKLHAVQHRLQLEISAIVERHRTNGDVLTWKLLHKIEGEALRALEKAGDLDRDYIRMMRSSRWGYIPRSNEPAELEEEQGLPETVSYIHQAYRICH